MNTEHGLAARFLRGLATAPDGVAVRLGAETLTYRRLHELALRWGGALTGHRAVGVLAGKGVTGYAGVLAALYAGAAVVPLRPDFPAARTRRVLAASGATALLVDDAGLAVLPAVTDGGLTVLAPDGGALPVDRVLDEPARVAPTDPAYVLFTSGSTGRPKGVYLSHASLEHYFGLVDRRYDFGQGDVFSQTFDLNFDCALFDLFCAWGAGATVLPVPAPAYRDLPAFLADRGVTVWFSTPAAIGLARRTGGLGPGSLPGLRWSFFAGEALRCRDAGDWQRAAPASTLENLYGPTELTITVSAYRWRGEDAEAVNGVVPIGTLHSGHSHLLLGPDGEPAGPELGAEGELCVAGPQLTPGYVDPADEPGRFFERDGLRWYRTGDRVRRIADGLAYLGRGDSQVQVQGWRVELAEVEEALRACGAADAVAVGVPAGGSTELVAFYTGEPVATVELVRRLRAHLPDGVIPRRLHHLDELPLNANRKVDRALLARRAADGLATTG